MIDYERYYQERPLGDGWTGERAGEWRRLSAELKADHVESLLRMAGLGGLTNVSVLEVGCGDGSVLVELARRGCGPDVVGVEISQSAVALAQGHPEVTRAEVFDGVTLPFGADAFDLVLATHVLEHVEDPSGLLREMTRVARRFVVVEVPLEDNLLARRPRARGLARHVGHVQRFNRAQLRRLLADAGLERRAELVDALPRRVRVFHDGPWRGNAKWLVRSLLAATPWGERLMTMHGAALGLVPAGDGPDPAPGVVSVGEGQPG